MASRSDRNDFLFGDFLLGELSDDLSDDENDFLSTINLNELFNENQQIKPTATVRLEDGSAKQEPEDAKLAAEQAEDLMEDFVNDFHNFQAPKRFKSFEEEDINKIEGKNQSSSTKKNTKWGVNIFQGNFECLL